jgi:hypothetical protein
VHPVRSRSFVAWFATLAASAGPVIPASLSGHAATHSPYFLMGCVEAQQGVNIVRLGYRGGVGTARSLPAADLER